MNRVTIILEADHIHMHCRHESMATFPSADYTREDVLDVFESALRGMGFHCPLESLRIVESDEGAS